jgi:hypothetical protein
MCGYANVRMPLVEGVFSYEAFAHSQIRTFAHLYTVYSQKIFVVSLPENFSPAGIIHLLPEDFCFKPGKAQRPGAPAPGLQSPEFFPGCHRPGYVI